MIIYIGDNEMFITTEADEKKFLCEYFELTDRHLSNFDRTVCPEGQTVEIKSQMQIRW